MENKIELKEDKSNENMELKQRNNELKNEIKELVNDYRNRLPCINQNISDLETTKKELNNLKNKFKYIENQYKNIEKDRDDCLNRLKQVYKDDYVDTRIIKHLSDQIENKTRIKICSLQDQILTKDGARLNQILFEMKELQQKNALQQMEIIKLNFENEELKTKINQEKDHASNVTDKDYDSSYVQQESDNDHENDDDEVVLSRKSYIALKNQISFLINEKIIMDKYCQELIGQRNDLYFQIKMDESHSDGNDNIQQETEIVNESVKIDDNKLSQEINENLMNNYLQTYQENYLNTVKKLSEYELLSQDYNKLQKDMEGMNKLKDDEIIRLKDYEIKFSNLEPIYIKLKNDYVELENKYNDTINNLRLKKTENIRLSKYEEFMKNKNNDLNEKLEKKNEHFEQYVEAVKMNQNLMKKERIELNEKIKMLEEELTEKNNENMILRDRSNMFCMRLNGKRKKMDQDDKIDTDALPQKIQKENN